MTPEERSEIDSSIIDLTPDSSPRENGRRNCKFIIIEYQDKLHLVFGDVSTHKYHANLLYEFCNRHGIAVDWVHEPDLLEPLDSSIDILGGGFLELNVVEQKATFSGASKAYGPFHLHQLEAILTASPQFASMTIRSC